MEFKEYTIDDLNTPKELEYEDEYIKINVLGSVHLKHLYVSENCKELHITGDTLTVLNPLANVAIGVPIEHSLSGGRFYIPDANTKFVIDCKKIRTESGLLNCGIGICAKYAVKSTDFTDRCIIRDTPVNMCVYNKPLVGSTKHSELPEYLPEAELHERENAKVQDLMTKFCVDKANDKMVNLMYRFIDAFDVGEAEVQDAYYQLLALVDTVMNNMSASTYAEGVQRIFASLAKACFIKKVDNLRHLTFMFTTVGFLCMMRELQLFPTVIKLPLAMHYVTVMYDLAEELVSLQLQGTSLPGFHELGLNTSAVVAYNHPVELDCSKEAYRQLWGVPYYDWTDCNKPVFAKLEFVGNTIVSSAKLYPAYRTAGCFVTGMFDWCYSAQYVTLEVVSDDGSTLRIHVGDSPDTYVKKNAIVAVLPVELCAESKNDFIRDNITAYLGGYNV